LGNKKGRKKLVHIWYFFSLVPAEKRFHLFGTWRQPVMTTIGSPEWMNLRRFPNRIPNLGGARIQRPIINFTPRGKL
jgi:hypothetical protein